jgi:small subunit ribosomal protein S1
LGRDRKTVSPSTHVKGKIVSLVPYGAFLEIESGIEGLIHVSEMSWTKTINDPSEMLKKGDEVEAIVLSVQKDEGKISLGMKQLEKNPWDEVEKKYSIGSNVTS